MLQLTDNSLLVFDLVLESEYVGVKGENGSIEFIYFFAVFVESRCIDVLELCHDVLGWSHYVCLSFFYDL